MRALLAVVALAAACATAPTPAHTAPPDELPAGEPPPLVVVHKRPAGAAAKDAGVAVDARPAPQGPAMIVHLLDVGQGAATLVELPCGAVLVDTGGEEDEDFDSVEALDAQLDAFFARRTDLARTIDVLFITHPHIDHVRGVPSVLSRYTVKNVVDDGLMGARNVHPEEEALRAFVAEHHAGYRGVHRDDVAAKTGLTDDVIDPLACAPVDPVIRVLSGSVDGDPGWGRNRYGKREVDNMNNHSLVVRFDFGKSSFLVTGDLEEVAIHDLVDKYAGTGLLDADVLEAGHHGSYNGTTPDLMRAVTPDVALISVGSPDREHPWTAWAFGHPREQAVQLLEGAVKLRRRPVDVLVGIKVKGFVTEHLRGAVFATGWDGPVDVTLGADGALAVARAAPPSS